MQTIIKPAKDVLIPNSYLGNDFTKVKVGAIGNKERPRTIYIQISFWITIKDEFSNLNNKEIHRLIEKEINESYNNQVRKSVSNNKVFPFPDDNIFIKHIPDNLNYNNKRNYVCIELYLHTINISNKDENWFLSSKLEEGLYAEAKEIAKKLVEEDFYKGKKSFNIFKKSS